jgi:DNA-binding NtrC family response regulator
MALLFNTEAIAALGIAPSIRRADCAQQHEALRASVRRCAGGVLAAETSDMDSAESLAASATAALIGESPRFKEALRLIRKLASCEAPALIQGETGTGKELAARAIHYCGPRRQFPFIPVNCGAIPDNLVENEFFGHRRGAYTDAKESENGIVASAAGGTLFLDEVECLSLRSQSVLLRFLQDQMYRPLGAREFVVGNARIIAASNCELAGLVSANRFRQDLMYRLAVICVTLPPLRERPGDVILLAQEFARRYARQYDVPLQPFDSGFRQMLLRHTWPGNVRELENLIHRQFVLNEAAVLDQGLGFVFGSEAASPAPAACKTEPVVEYVTAKMRAIEDFDRAYLTRVLTATGGNVTQAARLAGKERRAFGKLMRRYSISNSDFDA